MKQSFLRVEMIAGVDLGVEAEDMKEESLSDEDSLVKPLAEESKEAEEEKRELTPEEQF